MNTEKFVAAVAAGYATGYTPNPGSYRNDESKQCCALGAAVIATGSPKTHYREMYHVCDREFDMSEIECEGLSDGFHGHGIRGALSKDPDYHIAFMLGDKLHQQYVARH